MGIITLDISAQDNQSPNSTGWLRLPITFGQLYVFTLANFTTETTPAYNDPEGDDFASLKITSLPGKGVISNNGSIVTVGSIITSSDLTNGNFKYQANSADLDGYTDGEMEFTVTDEGSGVYTTSPKSVTFEVESNINRGPSSVGDGETNVVVGESIAITKAMLTNL